MIPRLLLLSLLLVHVASAQTITNGSFATGDFTGWQVSSSPQGPVVQQGGPPTPVNGNYQALINSTGDQASGIYATSNAVSAVALNTFLNTTLPGNANGSPVNGEAIQQTFTTTANSTLTFSYSYQSREAPGNGYDETGYVLNGVFHILADTSTPGQSTAYAAGFFAWGLPYQTTSITVPAGTNTIAFVAYNTGNTEAPSGLFINNVSVTTTTDFGAWENSFSFSGPPAGAPENDGVTNLLKYVCDINPTRQMTVSDRGMLPMMSLATIGGTQYLTLTFREYAGQSGIAVNVQTSSDSVNWTTVYPPDLSQQVGTDSTTQDPIIELGVVATGTRQFIRLNVASP